MNDVPEGDRMAAGGMKDWMGDDIGDLAVCLQQLEAQLDAAKAKNNILRGYVEDDLRERSQMRGRARLIAKALIDLHDWAGSMPDAPGDVWSEDRTAWWQRRPRPDFPMNVENTLGIARQVVEGEL